MKFFFIGVCALTISACGKSESGTQQGITTTVADAPSDTETDTVAIEKAVSKSTDFSEFNPAMMKAAIHLVESKICTVEDFEFHAGWEKSVNRGESDYFLYCGNHKDVDGRVYLNVRTGIVSH